MKSPYRISAKEVDAEPRSAGPRSYAVLICIALGVIVQLVGLLTHGLDAFGHVAFAFAFGLGTAGLQAGSKSAQPLDERSDGASAEDQPRRAQAPAKERASGEERSGHR
jgi:hypothetical protein